MVPYGTKIAKTWHDISLSISGIRSLLISVSRALYFFFPMAVGWSTGSPWLLSYFRFCIGTIYWYHKKKENFDAPDHILWSVMDHMTTNMKKYEIIHCFPICLEWYSFIAPNLCILLNSLSLKNDPTQKITRQQESRRAKVLIHILYAIFRCKTI